MSCSSGCNISGVNTFDGLSKTRAKYGPRARVQFVYGDEIYARLQFRDGSQERVEGSDFKGLFDRQPSKVRIYANLPVLKKISILVAAEPDPNGLCFDAEKTLAAADIAVWTGENLSDPLREVWSKMPDRLRDHSYLALAPSVDLSSWEGIADEFVEVIRVDPRRAQEAKSAKGGVDKVAFKEAGGTQVGKTIKKEIDLLLQSANDAGESLLTRHADALESNPLAELAKAPAPQVSDDQPDDFIDAAPSPRAPVERPVDEASPVPSRNAEFSVPLGKVWSRSRMVKSPVDGSKPKITQRTVSQAIKNMPKVVSRPTSKSNTRKRVRSRLSRPATPWSLDI